MIYGAGFLGFVCGFVLGQMLLYVLLRHRSRQDLIKDKSLAWTYGVLNWIIAGIGAYGAVFLYTQYLG